MDGVQVVRDIFYPRCCFLGFLARFRGYFESGRGSLALDEKKPQNGHGGDDGADISENDLVDEAVFQNLHFHRQVLDVFFGGDVSRRADSITLMMLSACRSEKSLLTSCLNASCVLMMAVILLPYQIPER